MRRQMCGVALVGAALAIAGCAPSTGTSSGETGSGRCGEDGALARSGRRRHVEGRRPVQRRPGQDRPGIKVDMTLLSRQDTFSKEATLMAAKSSNQDIYFVASYNVGQFAASLDPLTSIDAPNYFPVAVDGLEVRGQAVRPAAGRQQPFPALPQGPGRRPPSTTPRRRRPTAHIATEGRLGQQLAPKPAAQWDLDRLQGDVRVLHESRELPQVAHQVRDDPAGQEPALQHDDLGRRAVGLGGLAGPTRRARPTCRPRRPRRPSRLYSDIYTNGWASPDSSQAEFPETQAALKSGNAAFAVQWSAGFAELNDPAKSPRSPARSRSPASLWQDPRARAGRRPEKYSGNKGAATKFHELLATPAAMTTYAKAGGIPAMPQVLKDHAAINPAFPDDLGVDREARLRRAGLPPDVPGVLQTRRGPQRGMGRHHRRSIRAEDRQRRPPVAAALTTPLRGVEPRVPHRGKEGRHVRLEHRRGTTRQVGPRVPAPPLRGGLRRLPHSSKASKPASTA